MNGKFHIKSSLFKTNKVLVNIAHLNYFVKVFNDNTIYLPNFVILEQGNSL